MTTRKSKTPRTMSYDARGWLEIKDGKTEVLYKVEEIYPDAGFGGRGFEVRRAVRVTGEGVYHVHAGEHTTCDCKGFIRWSHCKHAAAIEKLLSLGMLPDPRENIEADTGAAEVAEQPAPKFETLASGYVRQIGYETAEQDCF